MKQDADPAFLKVIKSMLFRLAFMRLQLLLFLTALLWFETSFAQNGMIPVGTWRTHYSYYNSTTVESNLKFVYSGSSDSFFRFDLENFQSERLTKDEGFSGLGLQTMKYQKERSFLLLGYDNGQLDYIEDDRLVGNIPDIINSQSILGSKSINSIHYNGDFAFLSCDFGVVKLDIVQKEIPEDYRNLGGDTVGNNPATSTVIYESRDSIFVATQKGLMVAPFRPDVNLQDGTNWKFFENDSGAVITGVEQLELYEDRLYASIIDTGGVSLQYYDGSWTRLRYYPNNRVKQLTVEGNQLAVVVGPRIEIWNKDGLVREITDPAIPNPQAYTLDPNAKDWVGSFQLGLQSDLEGEYRNYSPPGPFSNLAQQARYTEDKMVITGGSYNPDNSKEGSRFTGFYEFDRGEWTNFHPFNVPNTEQIPFPVRDVVSSTYNSITGMTYYCSNGYGLISRDKEDNWILFNEKNSPLENQDPTNNYRAVRVLDAAPDSEGYLWLTNTLVGNDLNKYHPDEGWQSFEFSSFEPSDLLIDNSGQKWIRGLPNRGGGILVFEEGVGSKKLGTNSGSGNLPSNRVNAIEMDKNGDIWVGTDDGVAVFFSPESILSPTSSDAITPIFENRPLLRFEKVTTIAVDGGNRKWIGTQNGVWLFNPDGSEVIENFRANNSPLPSDKIIDIGIHPKNGEVFFVTENGLVSYRGTATEGSSETSCVEVFPNPVPPNYSGMITITCLPENSLIKIVDLNGKIFYETRAAGGTAAWNGRDYNGNKPKSGVYTIFGSDTQGEETILAKIAIIN